MHHYQVNQQVMNVCLVARDQKQKELETLNYYYMKCYKNHENEKKITLQHTNWRLLGQETIWYKQRLWIIIRIAAISLLTITNVVRHEKVEMEISEVTFL